MTNAGEGLVGREASIRLFVTDVDGTLTDGGMYYGVEGELMKRFNTRDAMGLQLLRDAGIAVAIITAEDSAIVLRRAEKLRISDVVLGAQDKLTELRQICDGHDIELSQVAYVGDDVNDLEVMRAVGVSYAVADAVPAVQEVADLVLSKGGGFGAVREAAERVLAALGAPLAP